MLNRHPLNAPYLDPYLIAEIGVNHGGSIERAKSLIESAARGGAHAAKFQTYKADKLASQFSSPAYWDTSKEPTPSQFALFSKYDAFGPDEYAELAAHCARFEIDFMSTPFDLDAVDMLDPLVPYFKIASADLTNVPLIRRVAGTRKPIILSVGAATDAEIERAVRMMREAGAAQLALLHCVLNYPTPANRANLAGITRLQKQFGGDAIIGYSDHVAPTPDGEVPALELATTMGARIIEKHFTDDRTAAGNDHYHAVDEAGLHRYMQRLGVYRTMLGTEEPDIEAQESAVVNARRRIFTLRAVEAGHVLSEDDLIPLRADRGLPVAGWDDVVGSRLTVAKNAGEPIEVEEFTRAK